MDPVLQILLNWQLMIFGLAIAAVVYVIRIFSEYMFQTHLKWSTEGKFWNDVCLPILPVILGPVAAWTLPSFPYPTGLTAMGGRFIFGLVAGLLSGLFYRVIKSLLLQKTVIDPTDPVIAPPAPPVPSVPVSTPSTTTITTDTSTTTVVSPSDPNLPARGSP